MTVPCAAPGTGSGFLAAAFNALDCQAELLGSSGYQALSNAGSSLSLVLTSLLTLFVAIIGIRMLMGQMPSFGDVIGWGVKIGVVLALAASWQAYRVSVYDVVMRGPSEIAATIGGSAALPGSNGDLVARLQGADNGIMSLVAFGTGPLDAVPVDQEGRAEQATRSPLNDDFALGIARTAFVWGALAGQGLTRLLAGVLLAIAPLFAGLLLFTTTRDFFWGWARSLVAVALGGLTTALCLAVELSILEPWLGNVLALRAAKIATPNAPFELLALALTFGAIMLGGLMLATRLAFSSGVSTWAAQNMRWIADRTAAREGSLGAVGGPRMTGNAPVPAPTRAAAVAEAVLASERREALQVARATLVADRVASAASNENGRGQPGNAPIPLGQTYRRSARRTSAAATRRSAT